jgi:hypothetical protein
MQGPRLLAADSSIRCDWILTRAALNKVTRLCRLERYLQESTLAVIEPRHARAPRPPEGVSVRHWVTFTSCDSLEEAAEGDRLPAWADTVVYDCEAWPHTPRHEQVDAIAQIRRAALLSHRAGRRLVAAPSLGLARRLVPDAHSGAAAYLASRLAETAAECADGLHIQSQSLERRPADFLEFVMAVAERTHVGAAAIELTAGLSTNPPGSAPTVQQLLACVRSTAPIVTGYWLNVPEPGPWCPNCPPARPEVAAELLSLLTPQSGPLPPPPLHRRPIGS